MTRVGKGRENGKEACRERNMSGEKSVSGLGLQSCQEEGLSKFRDDKRKMDGEKVASSEKKAERNMSSRNRRPNKQQEGWSRFTVDNRKRGQEKLASSNKISRARNVKEKEFQEITQSTAVPARW